jgi:hypothetical protein
MNRSRRGQFILPVLVSSTIALTLMGAFHQTSCATALRAKDAQNQAQLAILVESGKRLAAGTGLRVPLAASGPGWSLEVGKGPNARLVARAGHHQHTE